MQRRRETTYKESLEIRGKELELEKKLAADKVDWKGKRRLEGMKYRKEAEDKYNLNYDRKGTSEGK